MRSFRLDRQSISEFIESWPILVVGIAITAGLAYLGWFGQVWRLFLILFAGFWIGYVAREQLHRNLVERYPNARFVFLLAAGIAIASLGAICRMVFPAIQASWLDIAWIVTSFICILTFVILNRRDPDVVQ